MVDRYVKHILVAIFLLYIVKLHVDISKDRHYDSFPRTSQEIIENSNISSLIRQDEIFQKVCPGCKINSVNKLLDDARTEISEFVNSSHHYLGIVHERRKQQQWCDTSTCLLDLNCYKNRENPWSPSECSSHVIDTIKEMDIQTILRSNTVVPSFLFIGDSRARQLFEITSEIYGAAESFSHRKMKDRSSGTQTGQEINTSLHRCQSFAPWGACHKTVCVTDPSTVISTTKESLGQDVDEKANDVFIPLAYLTDRFFNKDLREIESVVETMKKSSMNSWSVEQVDVRPIVVIGGLMWFIRYKNDSHTERLTEYVKKLSMMKDKIQAAVYFTEPQNMKYEIRDLVNLRKETRKIILEHGMRYGLKRDHFVVYDSFVKAHETYMKICQKFDITSSELTANRIHERQRYLRDWDCENGIHPGNIIIRFMAKTLIRFARLQGVF